MSPGMAAAAREPGLLVLTPREASIFACLCDTVVAPEPLLPPVRHTDAVASFDRLLAASPRMNRAALRTLLYAAELAPWAVRMQRLRRLHPDQRGRALARLEAIRSHRARELLKLARGLACLSYYGDDAIMRRLGFDAGERVRRGRHLRITEGRA
jgi:hypothetical protein